MEGIHTRSRTMLAIVEKDVVLRLPHFGKGPLHHLAPRKPALVLASWRNDTEHVVQAAVGGHRGEPAKRSDANA